MKNLLLYTILVFSITINLKGQNDNVGIGTANPDASAVLDVTATNKGFIGPNIALESRTDAVTIPDPADGLIVFNVTELTGNEETELIKSYYYWKTDRWYPLLNDLELNVVTNGVLPGWLGYEPDGTHDPDTFTEEGVTYTGLGCKQWTVAGGGNGHWYCAYRRGSVGDTEYNDGFTWFQAFDAAQSKGGYLATLTSTDEWQWVRTNLVDNGTGYNLASHVWIGFSKLRFAGNTTEFVWITGEKSRVGWNNLSSLPNMEHYFSSGEPNNSGGNEGCTHITSVAAGRNRAWNDIPCNDHGSGGWAGSFSELIIEFEQ